MTVEQPFGFLKSGFTHRVLIACLGGRRIEARYRGSFAGVGWLLLHPVLMLGIYTLVFSWVFEARWGAELGSTAAFGLFLFSGVLLYLFDLFRMRQRSSDPGAEERKLQLLCEQLCQPRLLERRVLGANAFDSKVFPRATQSSS